MNGGRSLRWGRSHRYGHDSWRPVSGFTRTVAGGHLPPDQGGDREGTGSRAGRVLTAGSVEKNTPSAAAYGERRAGADGSRTPYT